MPESIPASAKSPARARVLRRLGRAGALLLAVVAVGAYVFVWWHSSPLVWPDACGYLSSARLLATRHIYGLDLIQINEGNLAEAPGFDPVGWWPPGYPAAIAVAAGEGASVPSHLIAAANYLDLAGDLAAAAGIAVLVVMIAGSTPAGLVCGALYLLSGPSIMTVSYMASEHVFMPLVIWASVIEVAAIRRGGWGLAVGSGVLWGAACLTRYFGVVVVGCAGLAALTAMHGEPLRARMRIALTIPAVAWGLWLIWVARCYLVAGHFAGHYAASESNLLDELVLSLAGYLCYLCGGTIRFATMPLLRGVTAIAAPGLICVAWYYAVVAAWRRGSAGSARQTGARWLIGFSLLLSMATIATAGLGRAGHYTNPPVGRYTLAACAFTLASFVAVSTRSRRVLAIVVAIATLAVINGFDGVLALSVEPSADALLAEFRPLERSERLQRLVDGKAVLLTAGDCVRPSTDLVTASVFLPTARTVYWVDQPEYTGLVVDGEDVDHVVREGDVDFLLAGPKHLLQLRLYETQPGNGFLGRKRFHVRYSSEERFTGHDYKYQSYCREIDVRSRPVLRAGVWELREVTDDRSASRTADRSSGQAGTRTASPDDSLQGTRTRAKPQSH